MAASAPRFQHPLRSGNIGRYSLLVPLVFGNLAARVVGIQPRPRPARDTRLDGTCRSSMSTDCQTSDVSESALNVLGGPLKCCCRDPMTGFHRDGFCHTGPQDFGRHTVCAQVTEEFLAFTAARGNDLSTPQPPFFPGLKPGDRWCLCVSRWKEALDAGAAPPVLLEACHQNSLLVVTLEQLRAHAIEPES